jgi:formylglycine-generating enzyme required for sulfatase activity
LSWYEAFAFCIWDGGRLPTEAEFEYAATGGEENRVYPWGAAVPDATRAVYNGATLVVVGSKPAGAGRYGQLDLAGSLWEWVLDLYAPYGTSCDDCANLTTGTTRVLRGPSFSNTDLAAVTGLRAANRYQDGRDPALHLNTTGVRCARH